MNSAQLQFRVHFYLGIVAPHAPSGSASCARVRGRFLPSLVDSCSGVEQRQTSPCGPKHAPYEHALGPVVGFILPDAVRPRAMPPMDRHSADGACGDCPCLRSWILMSSNHGPLGCTQGSQGASKSMVLSAPGATLRLGELPSRVPVPQVVRSIGPDEFLAV